MKKIALVVLLTVLFSACDSLNYYEEEYEWGCHTAVNKAGDTVMLHCCVWAAYYEESQQITVLTYKDFTEHEWKKVSDCSECQ